MVDITSSTPITIEMLTTKGTGTGILPMQMNEVIGKTSMLDIIEDQVIMEENFQWTT